MSNSLNADNKKGASRREPVNRHQPGRGYRRTHVLPAVVVFGGIYLIAELLGLHINAVVLTIVLMISLCLLHVPVAIALVLSALLGGLHAGLSVADTLTAMNDNLLIGAQVGMTYIMIGAFAVALARSGLLDLLARAISNRLNGDEDRTNRGVKWSLFLIFILAAILSQNLIPVHIAFIPILIPPLLGVMNRLQLDRRAVACVIACMISTSYLLLPTGFGAIYLNEILMANVNQIGQPLGLSMTADMAPKAMFLPVLGIIVGMLVAVFFSYRRSRDYQVLRGQALEEKTREEKTRARQALAGSPLGSHLENQLENQLGSQLESQLGSQLESQQGRCDDQQPDPVKLKPFQLLATLAALVVALVCQIQFDSLFIGAMVGFVILSFSGIYRWQEQDDVFIEGVRMMAQIAVIITIASGFAGVLTATGEITPLVSAAADFIGENKAFGALMMLVVGLFITIGFGDSFASVPILAPIYIPLALMLGFSPLAVVALLGASAALGDAGSPASTITLGATAGLNADGQHDHISDSVLPIFFHANLGMVAFAWLAAMVL